MKLELNPELMTKIGKITKYASENIIDTNKFDVDESFKLEDQNLRALRIRDNCYILLFEIHKDEILVRRVKVLPVTMNKYSALFDLPFVLKCVNLIGIDVNEDYALMIPHSGSFSLDFMQQTCSK